MRGQRRAPRSTRRPCVLLSNRQAGCRSDAATRTAAKLQEHRQCSLRVLSRVASATAVDSRGGSRGACAAAATAAGSTRQDRAPAATAAAKGPAAAPERRAALFSRPAAAARAAAASTEATVSAMAGLSEEALRDTYTRISRAAVALRQELEEQQQLLLLHARQRRVLDAELAELKGRVVLPPVSRPSPSSCSAAAAAATATPAAPPAAADSATEEHVPKFLREDPFVALPAMLGDLIGRYKQPAKQLGATLLHGMQQLQQELHHLQQHQKQSEAQRRAALREKAILRQQECLEHRAIEKLKKQHMQKQQQHPQPAAKACAPASVAAPPASFLPTSRQAPPACRNKTLIARLQHLFSDPTAPPLVAAPPQPAVHRRSFAASHQLQQQQRQMQQKQLQQQQLQQNGGKEHPLVEAPAAQLFRIWSDGDATPEQDSTRIADVPALQKAVCRRGSNARAGAGEEECHAGGLLSSERCNLRNRVLPSPSSENPATNIASPGAVPFACAGGVSTLAAAEVNVSGASSPLPPSPHSATEDCVIVAAEILVGSRSLPLRLAATESCEEAAAAWVDRHWGALQKHWRAGCPAATFLGRNKAIESLESFLRNVEETSEELPVKVTRSWSLILDPQSEKQLN
ncbi:uncharacterized protein LOC113147134 [Cyclospora cayetanensis]|uniref:Uncharacterized protein LOC113147134 n=1 Tax=Cyclospora cayetanensis TaxID=88456 RepID=A0A6P6RWU8_9EIME|nr:uncharacterized protein LOC113147134 [Cyclospora cayetanensis]